MSALFYIQHLESEMSAHLLISMWILNSLGLVCGKQKVKGHRYIGYIRHNAVVLCLSDLTVQQVCEAEPVIG